MAFIRASSFFSVRSPGVSFFFLFVKGDPSSVPRPPPGGSVVLSPQVSMTSNAIQAVAPYFSPFLIANFFFPHSPLFPSKTAFRPTSSLFFACFPSLLLLVFLQFFSIPLLPPFWGRDERPLFPFAGVCFPTTFPVPCKSTRTENFFENSGRRGFFSSALDSLLRYPMSSWRFFPKGVPDRCAPPFSPNWSIGSTSLNHPPPPSPFRVHPNPC